MPEIDCIGVDDKLRKVCNFFLDENNKDVIDKAQSRNGSMMTVEQPVIVTDFNPEDRVLRNRERDANPFFHLMESVWMMAGMNDVSFLSLFNSRISQYSDDGKTFNGAYGHRWINYFHIDQVAHLIRHLFEVPNTRRAVLLMFSAKDVLKIEHSKDIPCNMLITFRRVGMRLDMSVHNRSNDAIWGLTGANAVHMSFLQEVMASCLELNVGLYHQITDNLHVYSDHWADLNTWVSATPSLRLPKDMKRKVPIIKSGNDPVTTWTTFHDECCQVVDVIKTFFEKRKDTQLDTDNIKNRFLKKVVLPMAEVFFHHKNRNYLRAFAALSDVADPDWKEAARFWVSKRQLAWNSR